ncbi:Heat shock protein DnaJ [Trichoderma guizhouense]|uniref:Heat shock protein DnaJ n=1 Tax=Trichoderma guizhouense TaxID=1491466 RepID=A0A1T3CDV8_9HYPO|nr:Heat shock protein DnaJ [Trichoderma guizhouense]
MSDDKKADLLGFANEYADKNIDLYELLGVDALTPKEDIHRAWRKASLNYHPDKARENFDAAKWELFERARDILSDPNARAAYDQSLKAKLLRKQEREAMDREHQKFADDLEARENAHRQQRQQQQQREQEKLDKERERLAEEQRFHEEEKKRQAEAAQEMEDLAEARRRLKEKKEEKARRKQVKESLKATGAVKKFSGPANGAVLVPGDYLVDLGSVKKMYWELVCDKLRAVQAVRNLQKLDVTNSEELENAEKEMREARQRIYDAETKFQQNAAV